MWNDHEFQLAWKVLCFLIVHICFYIFHEQEGTYKREYIKVLNLITSERIEMRRGQGWERLFMSSLYIFIAINVTFDIKTIRKIRE